MKDKTIISNTDYNDKEVSNGLIQTDFNFKYKPSENLNGRKIESLFEKDETGITSTDYTVLKPEDSLLEERVKEPITSDNVSNIIVTANGYFNQVWKKITHFPCKIVEITSTHIMMDCYDLNLEKIEIRTFDRSFFPKKLVLGMSFILTVFKTEGKITHELTLDKSDSFNKYTLPIIEGAQKTNWGKLKQ